MGQRTEWERFASEHLDLGGLSDADANDVVAEIGQMLEDHFAHLRSGGMNAAEAGTATRAHIEDWERLGQDVARAMRSRRKGSGRRLVEGAERGSLDHGQHAAVLLDALKDVQFAVRSLRHNPVTSLVMILTLAIGIGATTAIYSIVEAVVLRPLPYANGDRIGLITFTGQGLNQEITITPSHAMDFGEQAEAIDALGLYGSFTNTLALEDDSLVFVPIARVEPIIFDMLGIVPSRGRLPEANLGEEDDDAMGEAMISEELWLRHFGGEPEILGREIEVAGNSFVVVGVAPAGTRFLVHPEGERERIDVWQARPPETRRGNVFSRLAMVMLAEDTTFEQATVEINAIAERNRDLDFENQDGVGTFTVMPLRDRLTHEVRPMLYLLLGAVGFVLLLVCVNVANLMLVRSLRRSHEWSLRAALGASRGRIVRLGLAESGVLAAIGGVAGVGIAAVSLRVLPTVMPSTLPRGTEIAINPAVLLFAGVVSLLTAVLFGLTPAWQASRVELQDSLKEASRTTARGGSRASRALIVAQFAMALVLVAGAGLLLRTVVNLNQVDVGFEPDGLLTFETLLPAQLWEEPAERLQFYETARARLEAMPGVEAVSWTNLVPLSGGRNTASWAYDEESVERFGELIALFRRSMPGYFATIRMPILAGRDFTTDDVENDRYVLIVSERMAEMAWPGESPIGKYVTIDFRTPSGMTELRETEVIGVVPSSREVTLHGDEPPTAYLPAWSTRAVNRAIMRTSGDPVAMVPVVRELMRELGIRRPLDNVRAVQRNLDDATEDTRFVLALIGTFAFVAVLLAALGIYGVVSYLVGQRQHEIGIRMALGASRTAVRRMVMRQGMSVVGIGLTLGLFVALGMSRLIASQLYGVTPSDPITFAIVATLLLVIAAFACLLPARRATRVAPVSALRDE